MADDWKDAWQPVIEAVGRNIWREDGRPAADAVEVGSIRRYLEPLELGCALHYDRDVARQYGYADIVAPYTAMSVFTLPSMWDPGDPPLFDDEARDAQPSRTALTPKFPDYFPVMPAFFATDTEIDYIRPAVVGERLTRRGSRLVACEPKQTKVGRGAFIKIESEMLTEGGEVLARLRLGLYLYEPTESARV